MIMKRYATANCAYLKENALEAVYQLALAHASGSIASASTAKAVEFLKQCAERGHVLALFKLGESYLRGKLGLLVDTNKAARCFEEAAKRQHPPSQAEYSKLIDSGIVRANQSEAVRLLSAAAAQNDPEANYLLGLRCREGRDVAKNLEKAIQLLQRAAEQDHPNACLALAKIYQQGTEAPKDMALTVKYLKKAVNYGIAEAQLMLARCYSDGEGVVVDPLLSSYLAYLAAEQGDVEAKLQLGVYYDSGSGVRRNEAKTLQYYHEAATLGHPRGQTLYAFRVMLSENRNNRRDAILMLADSANNGNASAQFVIGSLYIEGKELRLDLEKAKHFLSLAAAQGHVEAKKLLDSIST
jgi:TPR repeat protein